MKTLIWGYFVYNLKNGHRACYGSDVGKVKPSKHLHFFTKEYREGWVNISKCVNEVSEKYGEMNYQVINELGY